MINYFYIIFMIVIILVIECILYFLILKNKEKLKKENRKYRFSLFNTFIIVQGIPIVIILLILAFYFILNKFSFDKKIISNLDLILVLSPPLITYFLLKKWLVVYINDKEKD